MSTPDRGARARQNRLRPAARRRRACPGQRGRALHRKPDRSFGAGAGSCGPSVRLPGVSATASEIIRAHQDQGFSRAPVENALSDLRSAKLIRAVHAENQLGEIMVDFWYNHFNVYAYAWEPSVPAYEREAIRPHALGRFRDLLGAVASHPAMLYFLDNYLSTGPRTVNGKTVIGLNENYGRELLELHTVGVDGGYSQSDVLDSARHLHGLGHRGPSLRRAPDVSVLLSRRPPRSRSKERPGARAAGRGRAGGRRAPARLAGSASRDGAIREPEACPAIRLGRSTPGPCREGGGNLPFDQG